MTSDKQDEHTQSRYSYPPGYIADILRDMRSIALVGASADPQKPSNKVLRFLHEAGYEMFPVNPNPALSEIHGLKVYRTLAEIPAPVDMVDVFRPKGELFGIAEQAIALKAKVLWGQLEIFDDAAAKLAQEAGLKVIMDRCPKIELSHGR